jgi:hypothetical protein
LTSDLAADITLKTQSEESMLITDVIENLGKAFKKNSELIKIPIKSRYRHKCHTHVVNKPQDKTTFSF